MLFEQRRSTPHATGGHRFSLVTSWPTSGMIRRFNRDTVWLATGVLGTVIFAAVMVAVQECQRKATEAERDLLLNANPPTVASLVAKTESAASTPVLALTPENRNDAPANP